MTTTPNREQIETHLRALVERLPDDAGLVLTKRRATGGALGRAADWLVSLDTLDASVDLCAALAPNHDLWVGTTATDEDTFAKIRTQGAGKRGGAADARFLIGTFADVDVAGDGHSKAKLPPSLAEARRILEVMPEPSITVATGGGFHPWWLFRKPVRIEEDRDASAALVDGFVRTLGAEAERLGWGFDDGVGDLARILRIGGTLNHKTGTPRPVTIEAHNTDDLIGATVRFAADDLARRITWRPAERLTTKAPSPTTSSSASTVASSSSAGLGILDACKAARWADLWPSDWQMVGTEAIDGTSVELWRRPGASSDSSVKCWPEGGCMVWSDAIDGLPTGRHSKADVLAWRIGSDGGTLARHLLGRPASGDPAIPASVLEAAQAIRGEGDSYLDSIIGSATASSSPGASVAIERAEHGFDTLTAAELAAYVDAQGPPLWLFRGVWASEDYGIISGPAKAGKSWICLDAAIAAASGTPWLGRFASDCIGPVLYFAGEGGRRKIVRRGRAIAASRGRRFEDLPLHVYERPPNLSNDVSVALLEATVERIRPVLTIIDPLYLAGGEKMDGAQLARMGEILVRPQVICQAASSALMVATHNNRQTKASGLAKISGAGPAEWGRIFLLVDHKRTTTSILGETEAKLELEFIGDEISGSRHVLMRRVWQDDKEDLGSPMHYQLTWSEEPSTPAADLPPHLGVTLHVLEEAGGWLTKTEILAALRLKSKSLSDSTITNHLRELKQRERIERDSSQMAHAYRVARPNSSAERIEEEPLL